MSNTQKTNKIKVLIPLSSYDVQQLLECKDHKPHESPWILAMTAFINEDKDAHITNYVYHIGADIVSGLFGKLFAEDLDAGFLYAVEYLIDESDLETSGEGLQYLNDELVLSCDNCINLLTFNITNDERLLMEALSVQKQYKVVYTIFNPGTFELSFGQARSIAAQLESIEEIECNITSFDEFRKGNVVTTPGSNGSFLFTEHLLDLQDTWNYISSAHAFTDDSTKPRRIITLVYDGKNYDIDVRQFLEEGAAVNIARAIVNPRDFAWNSMGDVNSRLILVHETIDLSNNHVQLAPGQMELLTAHLEQIDRVKAKRVIEYYSKCLLNSCNED